ncbi:MAG: tRNA 2-thiocytidine biosynthesis protein TtcA [Clostridiaceae bacterium]|nr:tRNA 2-thiocytidine biosynthesis protein TtcA [Clostridiaceae bacterium]
MKRIAGAARRAIADYNMIKDGDSIAVGISGGKDSMALLAVLSSMQKYLPTSFSLKAITIDMGFESTDYNSVAAYCKDIGVEYILHKTQISKIVFNVRHETNPCSLCAKLRKGALNDIAIKNGCNKVALGHHFDDAVETFFLSLFYEARLSCFYPVAYLDRRDITLIRPLLYVEESDIVNFVKRANLPVLHNECPVDGNTKREDMKNMLLALEANESGIKRKIFNAV